jgi:hypothetical protein
MVIIGPNLGQSTNFSNPFGSGPVNPQEQQLEGAGGAAGGNFELKEQKLLTNNKNDLNLKAKFLGIGEKLDLIA